MKRLSFNGGELSPELALRSDLDVYSRGCSCIENFDVSQMGGIKRRRGMRPFAEALDYSKIFAFEYTTDQRFLVELSYDKVRVFSVEGEVVYEAAASFRDPHKVCAVQVNALLLFASSSSPVMQLKLDASGSWSFSQFSFKHKPWRYYDYRDEYITVTRGVDGHYSVEFDAKTSELEKQCCGGERLRVSYWTDQAEAFESRASLLEGVQIIKSLDADSTITAGTKIAIRGEPTIEYYSCIQAFSGSVFTEGLTHPGNYSACFIRSEAPSSGATLTPIRAITSATSVSRGKMIAFESGYWEYFTCIADFTPADYISGQDHPSDYKGFFIRGLAVGQALPCKGTWKFACSGGWIGEYEVRRNRDESKLTDDWETLGASFSPMGANVNTAITGDEQEEECYLRLFVTRSYYLGDDINDGFPQDYCTNKLVVDSYKHDIELAYSVVIDEQGNEVAHAWERAETIKPELLGSIQSKDWSWQAFSAKYGYPALIETYGKRVVLAATTQQPVTIWMSKTDDLDNFQIGKTDDAALSLTMAAKTQNPICWLMARSEKIYLGTTDSEHIIVPSSGKAVTPTNISIENHGYIGSSPIPALMASDKVIYCERGSGRLYQFGYNYESDAYVSRDLTVFSDHILRNGGGVLEAAYVKKPYAKAVFVLRDGTVALMTYNSMHEVHAWNRYTTSGRIDSCAVLPNGDLSDSLFFIVEREDGRFIEVLDDNSPYIDGGRYDYTSTLITNALSNPESPAARDNRPQISFFLAENTETASLEVSVDGSTWTPLDRSRQMLPKGWQKMIARGGWKWESSLGIRASGNRGLHILALQREPRDR